MATNNLSEARTAAGSKILSLIKSFDASSATEKDMLLHGAMINAYDNIMGTGPDDILNLNEMSLQPQWVGVAYNEITDTFVRRGSTEGYAVGSLPSNFPNINPIYSRLRRVVLSDAGVVYKGISWTDKTKHDDGTTIDLSGANGQIMVEYLRKGDTPGYYRTGVWGDWKYFDISHLPLYGFSIHPAFLIVTSLYMGAHKGSIYGGKLSSIAKSPADGTSNVYPVTSRTTGSWGYDGLTAVVIDSLAAARGTGWMKTDFMVKNWESLLAIIAFASFDIPGIVGAGRINLSGGAWEEGSYIGKCGLSNSTSGYYSAVQNGGTSGFGTDYSHVLGVEDPWGNVNERITGLCSDGAIYYKSFPPYLYSSVSGWTRFTDALGNNITLPQRNGYNRIPHSGLGLCVPKEVAGGSSSTGMRDYNYYGSGLRVMEIGGTATDGVIAGPFHTYTSRAALSVASSSGCRLMYKETL